MDYTPIFFEADDNPYRLHFPYLLQGFDQSMLQKSGDKPYDANERQYEIHGFKHGGATYDIVVRELGADIAPSAIETWFFINGANTDVPADLRDLIAARNEDATKNRMQVYVNNIRISFVREKKQKKA